MRKNKHTGSNFDDFLEEEGLLEEIEDVVAKRIKAALAEKMETSRSAVDRILNPEYPSTLRSFAKAARALDRHLKIGLA